MSNDGKTSFEVFCSHCGQRLSLTINLGVAVNASITVPAFKGLTLAPKEKEAEEGVFVNLNDPKRKLPTNLLTLKGLDGETQRQVLLELRCQHGSIKGVSRALGCSESSIEALCKTLKIMKRAVEIYAGIQAEHQLPTQSILAATPDLNKDWKDMTRAEKMVAIQKAHADQEPVKQFCQRHNIGFKKLAAYRLEHNLLYKIKYVPKPVQQKTVAPAEAISLEKCSNWKAMSDAERAAAVKAAADAKKPFDWVCERYNVPASTLSRFKLIFGLANKKTCGVHSKRSTSKWAMMTFDQQLSAVYAAHNANQTANDICKQYGVSVYHINIFKREHNCLTQDMVANNGACPVPSPDAILTRNVAFLAETLRTTMNQIRTWLLVEPIAVQSLFSRPRDFKTSRSDWQTLKTQAEHSSGKLLKLMSETAMREKGYKSLNELLPTLDGSYNSHKKAILTDKTPAILRGTGFWIAESDIAVIRRTDKDIPLRKRVHGVLEVEADGYLVLSKLVKELKMTEHQLVTAAKKFETKSGKKALVTIKEPTGPGTKTIRVIDPKVWDPRVTLATA